VSELTQEEQTQLARASAKIEKIAIQVIAKSEHVKQVPHFYQQVHAEVDQTVTAAFEATPPAECEAGCAHCCKGRKVEVSLPEAFYIADQIKQLAESKQVRILESLAASVELGVDAQKKQGCAFLQAGLCSIYESRPAVCRKAHSQSVKACIDNQEIPQHLGALLGAEAIMHGTQSAYQALGYVADAYALNVAVYAALTNPTMLDDWHQAYLDAQINPE